jgi:hypothetical protein
MTILGTALAIVLAVIILALLPAILVFGVIALIIAVLVGLAIFGVSAYAQNNDISLFAGLFDIASVFVLIILVLGAVVFASEYIEARRNKTAGSDK